MKLINTAFIAIASLALGLIIYTIIRATSEPIVIENKYMDDYKVVDRNYGEILENEKAFDSAIDYHYKVRKDFIEVSLEGDEVALELVLLTRPHTKAEDATLATELKSTKERTLTYTIPLPPLRQGRYKAILKITHNNNAVFKEIPITTP